MKIKIFLSIILLGLFTSCSDVTTIYGNPVISQINIIDGKEYKYEVIFESEYKNNAEVPKMQTNFRYQVGDTLLSLYENLSGKLQPVRDSLNFYKSKYSNLSKEFEAQKKYIDFLQTKIPKE